MEKSGKFDNLIGKEVMIYDADVFEQNCNRCITEIINLLHQDYGIDVPNTKSFKEEVLGILINNIANGRFYGNANQTRINEVIILPYQNFAGKINIENARDFDILSESLKLATEISK